MCGCVFMVQCETCPEICAYVETLSDGIIRCRDISSPG